MGFPHTPKSVFWLLLVNQKRLEKGLVGLINPVFQSLAGEPVSYTHLTLPTSDLV